MKEKLFMLIGILFLCNWPSSAIVIHNYSCDKKECIRSESGVFNEDYLFMGRELQFTGEAEDLYFMGERLTFSGKAKLGVFSFCKYLIFSGVTGNGIATGGMDILIDGQVTGNSFVGCKSFNLTEKATMDGNLFIGCANLVINGKLNGDLYAGAGEVVINNEINGNVRAHTGRIIFGDKGRINGTLHYSSREKLSEKDSSKITGSIKFDKENKDWESFGKLKKSSIGLIIGFSLFISFLITGSLLLFLPAFRRLDAKQSSRTFWNTLLWGLIPVLMYPAVIILCFVLVVTIPLAITLILAFIPLFFIANIIGITLSGKYLVSLLKWKIEKRHYQFLIGALAVFILSLIPFINFLSLIFMSSLGWGVFISFLFNKSLTVEDKNAN